VNHEFVPASERFLSPSDHRVLATLFADRTTAAGIDTSAIGEDEGVRQSVAILRGWIDAAA
jgi:hypothetical protein